MTFSAIRDLTPAYESLSYLLPHAARILVTQCGIRVAVSTLMWHWVSRAGRGPGTDAGRGACGTRVRDWRGPRRRDSRGGETAAETGHGGICPENPAAHRQAGTRQSYGLSSDAPLTPPMPHW